MVLVETSEQESSTVNLEAIRMPCVGQFALLHDAARTETETITNTATLGRSDHVPNNVLLDFGVRLGDQSLRFFSDISLVVSFQIGEDDSDLELPLPRPSAMLQNNPRSLSTSPSNRKRKVRSSVELRPVLSERNRTGNTRVIQSVVNIDLDTVTDGELIHAIHKFDNGLCLKDELRFKLLDIVTDTAMNYHGYHLSDIACTIIEDILREMKPWPPFEKEQNKWINQQYPSSSMEEDLLIRSFSVLYLTNTKWNHVSDNKYVKSFVASTLRSSGADGTEYHFLYHGTIETSAASICAQGALSSCSNRNGVDFGPGFYVGQSMTDALRIADTRARSNAALPGHDPTLAACLIFKCPKQEFESYRILDLEFDKNDLAEENM